MRSAECFLYLAPRTTSGYRKNALIVPRDHCGNRLAQICVKKGVEPRTGCMCLYIRSRRVRAGRPNVCCCRRIPDEQTWRRRRTTERFRCQQRTSSSVLPLRSNLHDTSVTSDHYNERPRGEFLTDRGP